jgi:signal transduction histidine kinase
MRSATPAASLPPRGRRGPMWRIHFSILFLTISTLAETDPVQAPLTTIGEVRELTREQAATGIPVEIRCIATYSKPSIATLFVLDETGSIFIERAPANDEHGPVPGDRILVKGVTGEGLFATVIKGSASPPADVAVISHGPLPPPRPISGYDLSQPALDSSWVSLVTWVHEVLIQDGDVILNCRADNFDFRILLEGPLPPESVPWNLAETKIRVRGAVATTFNLRRQMTRRFLRVNDLADITPLAPEPTADHEAPLISADDMLRIRGPGPTDLVRIRGVTTLTVPGRGFYLETNRSGLWVQTAQPLAARAGTALEVTGWPRAGPMKPFIRAKSASIIGSGPPPPPLPLKATEALNAHHDARWVSVEAELLNSLRGIDATTLELRDADLVFRGLIPTAGYPPLSEIAPGSRIRITGIAHITPTGNFILQVEDKLQLLAGSPADVVVLAPPPYWTAGKAWTFSAIVTGGLLAYYAIARSRRSREQETVRREFEAVLAERGRFAREIHDSLAQGLTSVSLQLECVRDNLTSQSATAASHLELARSLVRDSLREARRTVWNLRPLALGEADLGTALQRYATHLSDHGKISCRQEIEGTPYTLSPVHEETLLRIGQESLTNAARHASATEIRHQLRFGPGWVTLSVRDNGKGFDVSEKTGSGFGLTGMHERIAALGGSLSIDSSPGNGTEVSATLPT